MSSTNTLVQEIKAWLATQYHNPKTLGNYHRECNTVLRSLLQKIGCNPDAPLSQEQIDTAMKQLNSTYASMRCYYALHHLTAYLGCQGCQSERFHLLCKTKGEWALKFSIRSRRATQKGSASHPLAGSRAVRCCGCHWAQAARAGGTLVSNHTLLHISNQTICSVPISYQHRSIFSQSNRSRSQGAGGGQRQGGGHWHILGARYAHQRSCSGDCQSTIR